MKWRMPSTLRKQLEARHSWREKFIRHSGTPMDSSDARSQTLPDDEGAAASTKLVKTGLGLSDSG
eukprot:2768602-Pyramimonas_sp.AAC.1